MTSANDRRDAPGDSEPGVGARPFVRLVRLPLGVARVRVDRRGLRLGARGGFEAAWTEPMDVETGTGPQTLDAFRLDVREHLRAVARVETGRSPTGPTLNLAAHQLADDLEGWSRLNAPSR